jgi:protein gp37
MATKSSIEWTEVTWNPVTGCTKVSPGCKNCYAEKMAFRLQAMGREQYKDGFKLTLAPSTLQIPYKWAKRKIVFVNSMSDLFHKDVPVSYIQEVFKVMNETQHIYQILTKRSERLLELSNVLTWSDNIWMGVSVESQKFVKRINHLSETQAKVKFLSIEPLIGVITEIPLKNIDWVIVGGESGPKARPVKKEWILSVLSECRKNNIPFFFKQWGHKKFNTNSDDPTINADHPFHAKGGCELDGVVYREMPQIESKMG